LCVWWFSRHCVGWQVSCGNTVWADLAAWSFIAMEYSTRATKVDVLISFCPVSIRQLNLWRCLGWFCLVFCLLNVSSTVTNNICRSLFSLLLLELYISLGFVIVKWLSYASFFSFLRWYCCELAPGLNNIFNALFQKQNIYILASIGSWIKRDVCWLENILF